MVQHSGRMFNHPPCLSLQTEPPSNPTSDMDAWKKLTHYLLSIQNISERMLILLHTTLKIMNADTNVALQSFSHFCFRVGSKVEVTEEISIDDLLGDVNRESYYRYNGSLTTPSCNEAVVWTVFKESIKVDQNLVCSTYHPGAKDQTGVP